MKLADVTSSSQAGGLPMWNFDSAGLPATMEETTGDSESNVEKRGTDSTAEGTGKTLCNGHDKSSGSAVNAEKNQKVITSLCNNNVNRQTSPTSTVNSNLVNTSGTEQHTSPAASLASGGTGGSQDTRKPDPVFEISLDLQVKIADLGNACWVVSYKVVHLINTWKKLDPVRRKQSISNNAT